jgi:hypothetical protein
LHNSFGETVTDKLVALVVIVAALTACGTNANVATSPTPRASAPPEIAGTIAYSFVKHFGDGEINSHIPATTPTGRGVLLLSWPFGPTTTKSLTVLATYRYTFRNILISKNQSIKFQVAKPYSIGQAVKASIDITSTSLANRTLSVLVPPAGPSGLLWSEYSVPLSRFSGHRVSISFSASAEPGGMDAAWVAFANPGIYGK